MTKLSGFEFWEKTLNGAQYVVAPMVDQSELAWRVLSRKYGAQLCYTPMLHANVFIRDANYRKEALTSCAEDKPLIVQFCANDPDTFLRAARLAEDHCDAIDLNLGCPQSIAKRGHYGAFLQDEWELLEKMVKLCNEKLKVPITCKIRVFNDVEKTIRYAQMLEAAGCQLLTVHGRTREMKGPNTGIADWEYIKAVREKLKIPVFANGNIQYLPDVHRCMIETGVQGVMSAEGNLHNPALFAGLSPTVWQMSNEYLDLAEKYPCPFSYMRGHLFKICHHALQIHTDVRDEFAKAKLPESLRSALRLLKEKSMEDVEKHAADPAQVPTDLPFPYWICQPYVRPKPEDVERRQMERDHLKRHLEEKTENNSDNLSRNQLKKRTRNPRKNFEPKTKKYEICFECANPKGKKCVFDMCKACCKRKAYRETLDCLGHSILFKTKLERRLKWEAEQKENEKTEERRNTQNGLDDMKESLLGSVT